MVLIKDISKICPFWDMCATIQFHSSMLRIRSYIEEVCSTPLHERCTHYTGLVLISEEEKDKIRRRLREKYGKPLHDVFRKPRYSLC